MVTLIELIDLSTPGSFGPIMPAGMMITQLPNDARELDGQAAIKRVIMRRG